MRLLYSYSSCRTHSPILLMEDLNARVSCCILITDGTRGICAAIINEEQLEVLIGLGQDTVYAAVQVLLGVIDRNDD